MVPCPGPLGPSRAVLLGVATFLIALAGSAHAALTGYESLLNWNDLPADKGVRQCAFAGVWRPGQHHLGRMKQSPHFRPAFGGRKKVVYNFMVWNRSRIQQFPRQTALQCQKARLPCQRTAPRKPHTAPA